MDPEKRGLNHIISKKLNLDTLFIAITLLLGVVVVINVVLTYNLNQELKKSTESAKVNLKPAKIELALIRNSKCPDCFDISSIIGNLRSQNVNISKQSMLEFDSKEGKEAIIKYKIERIPAVIIAGEIDKLSIQGLEKKDNVLALLTIPPPYTNSATGEIVGRVKLYHLKEPQCTICNDLTPLINQIKASGVKIYDEKVIATDSDEGKELIKKYNIEFAPTMILSKDAAAYDIVQEAWPRFGSRENDGSYVLRAINPPFVNLTSGKLRGLVNIIYLTDKSCTECYNLNQHREILTNPQSFAVKLGKEETADVSEVKGKELIKQYNITQVPTVILSNDISAYPSSQALNQFFSVEKDGSYIFRKLSVVGVYKDLATNQVVQAQQQTSQEQ